MEYHRESGAVFGRTDGGGVEASRDGVAGGVTDATGGDQRVDLLPAEETIRQPGGGPCASTKATAKGKQPTEAHARPMPPGGL